MLNTGEMCKNAKTSTVRTRKWRENNRHRHNDYLRNYRNRSISDMLLDHNEIWFEFDARKRKALKQATPPWVKSEAIREIYHKCNELNNIYPNTGFVVHHIIPIRHPKVCGLHIPENLKIVSLNMKSILGRKFNSK